MNGANGRIARLDQRTALPDQCLHSAEADVRPPRGNPGLDPDCVKTCAHEKRAELFSLLSCPDNRRQARLAH